MPYLSQIIGTPVIDASGEKIGTVKDLGASVNEVFPRITAIALEGPAKAPLMVSWRKYVESCSDDSIELNVSANDVRFSYIQPSEVLLKRDVLNKQVVDAQNKRAVRVNDLKLSLTADNQLRLLGAEVGVRGMLRNVSQGLEHVVVAAAKTMGKPIPERVIAWSHLDLLGQSHTTGGDAQASLLDDMHPADIADIIEQLDPELRAQVFSQLDTENAAATMSELEDSIQADVIVELPEKEASAMIAQMDPDDAADIIGELDHDKAEKLMGLMDTREQRAIRQLLGYSKDTAGGIMTSEFVAVPETFTVAKTRARLARLEENFEEVFYVYTLDEQQRLSGVVLMRDLVVHDDAELLADFAKRDLIYVSPEDDQETVAEEMSKYSLVGVPVVGDNGKILGIVTVDDALDVLEDEHERDMQLASGTSTEARGNEGHSRVLWYLRRELWFGVWVVASAILALLLPHSLVAGVLMFMPVVLLVADDVTPFASSYLIEDDEKPSVGILLVRNAVIGLVIGLLGFAVAGVALGGGFVPFPSGVQTGMVVLASAMITVFVLVASSAPYTRLIERRLDEGKDVPGVPAVLAWMAAGVAVYALVAWGIGCAAGLV